MYQHVSPLANVAARPRSLRLVLPIPGAVPDVRARLVGPGAYLRRAAWCEPLAIALVAHVSVLFLGYCAFWLVPSAQQLLAAPARPHALWGVWLSWDAGWYAKIALNGYSTVGPNAPTVAFWPLLPLLECLLARPLLALGAARTVAVASTALAINAAAFGGAAVVLHRLVSESVGREAARRAVALLGFAPGAVFVLAGYPESLLLLGVAGCFLALLRGRWAWAAVAGGLAAAAQVPGVLLVAPFAWAFLARERRPGRGLLWGMLIPVPPLLWLAFLGLTVGDPLAPIHAAGQQWHHTLTWPWVTLADASLRSVSGSLRDHPLLWINMGATLLALASASWAFRSGRGEWAIWNLLLVGLYLSLPATMPLDGMLRYILASVALWAFLGRIRVPEALLLAPSALLAGLLTALYVGGYWVA